MLTLRRRRASYKSVLFIAAALLLSVSLLGAVYGPGEFKASAQAGPRFALNTVVATVTNVSLRDQPAASGNVVVALPVNAQAIVIGGPFNDDWYWLNYNNGTQGYAQGKDLVVVDGNYKPMSTETPTTSVQPTAAPTGPVIAPTPVGTSTSATPAATPTQTIYTPSTPGDYTGLWLGELAIAGNVRSGPGLDQKAVKSWWVGRRVLLYQTAVDKLGNAWYRVSDPPEAPMWVSASLVRKVAPVQFQPARFKGKWVDVNISQQIATAYEDGKPVKVTLCSTGKGKNPTDLGTWKIYYRLTKQEMIGGNKASGDYYDLPDVPYVQYFNMTGEALHGTYWHDDFGHPHSHGCVNLSTPIAQWFYGWDTLGTVVYVHN